MADAKTLNLADFLPYRMSVATNAVSSVIARDYQARFGLKIPEWRVMAILGEGREQTQSDLVAATRMDKVTVSRAVRALADRTLLERRGGRKDGRSHGLALTRAGEALYAEIVPVALAIEKRLVNALSTEEVATLKALLDRMRAAADDLTELKP